MTLDLTDEEKLALAAELKRTIAQDRYPLSPRIQTLKAILSSRRSPDRKRSTLWRALFVAFALALAVFGVAVALVPIIDLFR